MAERIEDRKIVNPKGHEQDFTRAVLVIDRENLSLKTATRKELQKAVNKIDRNNIHRRVCSRLNSLLSFIGHRERLEAAEYNEVPTIFAEAEFLNLVENLEIPAEFLEFKEDIKTGRQFNFLDGNQLAVCSQMLKDPKKLTSTKTGKERVAYVIQNHFQRIQAWVDLERTTKEKLRDIEFSRLIKKAGRLTFPKTAKNKISKPTIAATATPSICSIQVFQFL